MHAAGHTHGPARSLLRPRFMILRSTRQATLMFSSPDHNSHCRQLPDLETPVVLRSDALLRCTHCSGNLRFTSFEFASEAHLRLQIGIVNHPDARPLPKPVTTIIAGAAPTAHLISELEKKNFTPAHVYGLTYVNVSQICLLASPS